MEIDLWKSFERKFLAVGEAGLARTNFVRQIACELCGIRGELLHFFEAAEFGFDAEEVDGEDLND